MSTDYTRPDDLADALRLLREAGDESRPLAGGQSLIPMLNLGLAAPTVLVDVRGLPELAGITETADGVRIGAATTHRDVVESPLVARHAPMLTAAAERIGSIRIRNVGTIGGSLAHADPTAELPLACTALDARYEIAGQDGRRTLSAAEFSQGYYTTALEPDELLVSIEIPTRPATGWGFQEYARRALDFAIVGVAVTLTVEAGRIGAARVVVSGVDDRPLRLSRVERDLVEAGSPDLGETVAGIDDEVDPTDDAFIPADFRRHLVRSLTRRALEDGLRRATEVAA